jgi:glycosyltransferase involved in cell wall biosynthesis
VEVPACGAVLVADVPEVGAVGTGMYGNDFMLDWLYPVMRSRGVESLRQGLVKLIEDEGAMETMRKEGIQYAAKYTMERYVGDLRKAIEGVM